MVRRILCPHHKEQTPSYVVYPSGAGHCFSCGAHDKEATFEPTGHIVPKEDITLSMNYIGSLPIKPIRGLQMPVDERFYYVLWPTKDYYKKRSIADSSSKYLSPVGHRKPLFIAQEAGQVLIVVEGEINAMSLAQCELPASIVSPGSAADFYSSNYQKYCTYYSKYDRVLIIADADKAGTVAAIELKTRLTPATNCIISLWPKDANDLLQEHGKHYLKTKTLGLLSRL